RPRGPCAPAGRHSPGVVPRPPGSAPAPADLEVAGGVPLVVEAGALDEAPRGVVVRLDVRLEPMELQPPERVPEHEVEPLAHQPLAGVRLERVVAEVRALEEAVRDLAEVEHAGDSVVLAPADEEAALALHPAAREIGVELARRLGRVDPGPVQLPAAARGAQELVAIRFARRAEIHPLGDFDRSHGELKNPARSGAFC